MAVVYLQVYYLKDQRELFQKEVNIRETIASIEKNNDTYCLQNRIEKFPLQVFKLDFLRTLELSISLS